jgi:peptidyl-prolyl cis-trans isomerase B (cyclophilin B)
LVVALCIGAVVVLAVVLNNGDGSDTTATPGSASSSGPLDSCAAAPAAPGKGQQFDQAPDKGLAKDATWIATLTTNCGDITIELDGAKAPQTVSSFVFLVRHGYFDDTPCHRLTTAGLFVLQCGDPTGKGTGGPGYGFGIENAPADGAYPRGTLAMARSSSPDSNGSQFFIVYKDSTLPTDGGGYSIFGTVTSGLDIVEAIAEQGVTGGGSDGPPTQPVSVLSVSVEEK